MGPNILIPQHFISVREQPVKFITVCPEVHSMVQCQDLMFFVFFAELSARSLCADKRQLTLNSLRRGGSRPDLPRTEKNKWTPQKELIKKTDGAQNTVKTKAACFYACMSWSLHFSLLNLDYTAGCAQTGFGTKKQAVCSCLPRDSGLS